MLFEILKNQLNLKLGIELVDYKTICLKKKAFWNPVTIKFGNNKFAFKLFLQIKSVSVQIELHFKNTICLF